MAAASQHSEKQNAVRAPAPLIHLARALRRRDMLYMRMAAASVLYGVLHTAWKYASNTNEIGNVHDLSIVNCYWVY